MTTLKVSPDPADPTQFTFEDENWDQFLPYPSFPSFPFFYIFLTRPWGQPSFKPLTLQIPEASGFKLFAEHRR